MSTETPYADIVKDGLWKNNAGLVQLLGLCPLLAVSNTAVNGLGLGLATTFVLVSTNVLVSVLRRYIPRDVRIPVFVLIIASLVTSVELIMNAWFHDLYRVLGIFVPLIVTNCMIIGRAEAFASRQPVHRAALDGLAVGIGFALVLFVLGLMRELLGQGTLFADAQRLFGAGASGLTLELSADRRGFLLALLPPGAFLGLALLIAGKNQLDTRRHERRALHAEPAPANS
jgi:electron transport complex protein RnfE